MSNATTTNRFCSDCGKSLVPLSVVHVERKCAECGQSVFVHEPGDDGKGIKITKGDSVRFPAGSIQISLQPKSGTHLFRPGVSWFVQQLLFHSSPKTSDDVGTLLDAYEGLAEEILKASNKLDDLNIEDEADSEKVFSKLSEDKDSIEWWAYLVGNFINTYTYYS